VIGGSFVGEYLLTMKSLSVGFPGDIGDRLRAPTSFSLSVGQAVLRLDQNEKLFGGGTHPLLRYIQERVEG